MANKKIEVRLGNEQLITPGGLATAGVLIRKTTLYDELDKQKSSPKDKADIKNSDMVGVLIGINCQGKSGYEPVNEFKGEREFYCDILGIKRIPSEEMLRQRMDAISESIMPTLWNANVELLRNTGVKPTQCYATHVPMDIDVSPFNNSKTKKEGVSWTYKNFDGYAPITAALGVEGYLIGAQLRPGSQHSQKGTPEFLKNSILSAKKVTKNPLLLRMDCGFDSKENIAVCQSQETKADFIIKRNLGIRHESLEYWADVVAENLALKEEDPESKINMRELPPTRDGKKTYVGNEYYSIEGIASPIRVAYEVVIRNTKANGQIMLEPEIEANTFWVSLDDNEETGITTEEVLQQYRNHATSEQFHAELKTDMDLERFPSKYFKTNAALFLIGIFSYNILRIIGQESLKENDSPLKRPVKRRRIRTVIQNLITIAVRVVTHSRKKILSLGRSNAWRHTYKRIHATLSA